MGKTPWKTVFCPNRRERANIGVVPCNAKLKVFKEPAVFEEVFFCPKCQAHWRITLNARGAARAVLLPDKLEIKAAPLVMHVIGEKIKRKARNARN